MAFNWQTFRTRSLTAAVFVVVMLTGLLWNQWSFFVLFSIVHFGAWFEYQKLVEKFNPSYKKITAPHRYGIITGGWCLMLFFTNYYPLNEIGLWAGILFMVTLPFIMWMDSKIVFLRNIVYSLSGLLY